MIEQAKVFLTKMQEKIRDGEYDNDMSIPFMNKNSIYASIKARVDKKIETEATPLLTATEIKDAIKDAKELAVITAQIFLTMGILEKTDDGEWIISDVARKAIPALRYAK